jgi:hypothetical protein
LGYRAAVGASRLNAASKRAGKTGDGLETSDTGQGSDRGGAGSAAAQGTVIRMADAPAGGLDVGLGPVESRRAVVVHHGIQTGQTGAGRQENGEQERRLDPAEARSRREDGAVHRLEYTQVRSAAVLRLTGPSAGSRNQKAVPDP